MAQPRKVLIIDDDLITRRSLCNLLQALGYITIQSGNGRHAWETLWENPDVSLVITDMMMPDMDGRELIQILRGNQVFAEMPVIAVSGVASADEVASVLRLNHCRYCKKPLSPEQLAEAVRFFERYEPEERADVLPDSSLEQ